MFSLVTALVSPSAIEMLSGKRETLVSSLTENAKVICFQPNDKTCLLQGDWENVKKAYAILEEFYFRAQAEMMVSEMLKTNASDVASSLDHLRHHLQQQQQQHHGDRCLDVSSWSNSFLSSLFNPTFKSQDSRDDNGTSLTLLSYSAPIGRETTTTDNDNKLKTTCNNAHDLSSANDLDLVSDQSTPNDLDLSTQLVKSKASYKNTETSHVDTTTTATDVQNACGSDGNDNDDDDDDDDPPVLSKEGDVISLSSDTSDPKELDFYAPSGVVVTTDKYKSTTARRDKTLKDFTRKNETNAKKNESNSEKSKYVEFHDDGTEEEEDSSEAKDNHSIFQNEVSRFVTNAAKETTNESLTTSSNPSSSSTLDILNQHIVTTATAAFRNRQFLGNNNKNGISDRKLPQFSSLLLGSGRTGANLPCRGIPTAAWQYADLYNMHLSSLQSIHVKQEPSSINIKDHHLHLHPLASSSSSSSIIHGDKDFKNDDRFEDEAQEMQCVRCNKTYRSEARMKEHVRTHSTDYVPVLHSCPKCSKSFTYRHNMVVHLQRFHYGWQPVKRHACRLCGIKFQKPYLLRLHEQKAHVIQHQLQL